MATAWVDDGKIHLDDVDEEEVIGAFGGGLHRPNRPPPPPLNASDRIVFVDDNGLVDTATEESEYDNVEVLTAEFRHQLGLLPEEEQELSEVFKASIGMTAIEQDRLEKLARDKQGTLENYPFEKFVNKYFRKGFKPQYSSRPLTQPILNTNDEVNKKSVPRIFQAIQRFMDYDPLLQSLEESRPKKPVMARVCELLNPKSPRNSLSTSSSATLSPIITDTKDLGLDTQTSHFDSPTSPKSPSDKKSKMSIKKFLRFSSSDKSKKSGSVKKSSLDKGSISDSSSIFSGDESDLDDLEEIPKAELDLAHYVIAHGILKPSLRDEIVCQLCCQVTENPSVKSRERGWMLLALCAGCFLPSTYLINYYYGFLHNSPSEVTDFVRYIIVILRRTNANGTRYHPPSWVELQAVKLRKYPVMQVGTPDGRVIPVESDPATTAWEICLNIAKAIGLKDHFGFSIYVGIQRKISSLGSGSDHVMDAISECEQMVRVDQSISEEKSPWRIYYQKEIFTPWHNPDTDLESTNLIYHQIKDGISRGEYALLPEEVPKLAARIFYIENGPEVDLDLIKLKMDDYLPKAIIGGGKARNQLAKSIMTAFETRGYSAALSNTRQIKNQMVSIATNLWPLNFSAMFEAFRHSGPPLPRNDVILAVNGEGIFLLDGRFKTILGFHYYDIVDCIASSSSDLKRSTVAFVTLDGAQFSFYCPNSTTIHKIISVYLEGLRRRSRWGVALQSFQLQDYTGGSGVDFRLRQGDIVELMDENRHPLLHATWLYGRCERTKLEGSFPYDVVYVLPTAERPDENFLNMFRSMRKDQMSTLPKRRSALILNSGTTGRHHDYGLESCA